jgi:quercetin dioxygenase-like cupin family protein
MTPPDVCSFRMGYTRVYNSPDGVSHFSDEVMAMEPFAYEQGLPMTHAATREPATSIRFAHIAAGYLVDWHPTRAQQFTLILSGVAEVKVEDGQERRFGPGSVLFLEDSAGRGHQVRAFGTDDVVYASIPL